MIRLNSVSTMGEWMRIVQKFINMITMGGTARGRIILIVMIAGFVMIGSVVWFAMKPSSDVLATLIDRDNTQPGQEVLAAGEVMLGRADAPITIIEYSSLTCPHCAAFHRDTLPRLKTEYIDKGYVRHIMRPFPLDAYATSAAMLVQCVASDYRFNFIEILFARQNQWLGGSEPQIALQRIAQQAGLSASEFSDCLRDSAQLEMIRVIHDIARQEFNINSTPTFFINGQRLEGNQPFGAFSALITPLLPAGAK